MDVRDFDYELPEELIAQKPTKKRDESRLMVVDREKGTVDHRHFFDITDYLREGDCLVFNNSKVIPARIFGKKRTTGVDVEFLLIKNIEGDVWETMVRPGRRLKPGDVVDFPKNVSAKILAYSDDGTRKVEFSYEGIFMERLDEIGQMPLPPYIQRSADTEDKDRYQTVYSKIDGSVAAPTAGLHFTEELIEKIRAKGVKTAFVTLHVGIGTFRPVKVDKVEDHHMHFEEYSIDEECAGIINTAKQEGARIISVGTTSTRTLESATVDGVLKPGRGKTDIFIYPGYEFKMVDSLITNFHLPKSTLLMLISALYDREKILDIYKTAVKERYRFFSYGDSMFII